MAGRLMEADANHDGLVSRAEFHLWRQSQFLRIDRNGDGFLSREDVPALLSAASARASMPWSRPSTPMATTA
jgi:Ca2+-binding EF-hand superfamily protein